MLLHMQQEFVGDLNHEIERLIVPNIECKIDDMSLILTVKTT